LAFGKIDTTTAMRTLHWIVKEAPDLAAAHYYLGVVYLQQANVQIAQQANVQIARTSFTKAIELDPELAEPYLALARLHMEARAFAQAFEVGQKDRKSTRLNSSHDQISYAVFCLKKKTMR